MPLWYWVFSSKKKKYHMPFRILCLLWRILAFKIRNLSLIISSFVNVTTNKAFHYSFYLIVVCICVSCFCMLTFLYVKMKVVIVYHVFSFDPIKLSIYTSYHLIIVMILLSFNCWTALVTKCIQNKVKGQSYSWLWWEYFNVLAWCWSVGPGRLKRH